MRRPSFRTVRKAVCAAVFVAVVAGLLFHTGTGTLSSMGVGSIAAVCPLGLLETLVTGQNTNLHALVLLVAMGLVALLLGRAFCAWLCPTPYVQRFFRRSKLERSEGETEHVARSCKRKGACAVSASADVQEADANGCSACEGCAKPLSPVGGDRDGLRLDSRHVVLGGTLLSAGLFGFPVFCLICPVGLTFATIVALWYFFSAGEATIGVLLFPAIIAVELVFFRRWCKTLCPLAALFSLAARFGPQVARPRVSATCLRAQGVDCRRCVEACPEGLDPHSALLTECTRCGDCAAACPAQAISMRTLSVRKGRARAIDADSAPVEL